MQDTMDLDEWESDLDEWERDPEFVAKAEIGIRSPPLWMQDTMDLDDWESDPEAAEEFVAKAFLNIQVNVKFYDYESTMGIEIGPTATAESLINKVQRCLIPPKHFRTKNILFKMRDEDVMLIFQGVDLLSRDSTATLYSFGIQDDDELIILHRGQFIGYGGSQSCDLKSLVGRANRAADSSISIEEFMSQNSDRKIIFVEVPLSEGICLRISIDLKLKDSIRAVKSDIWQNLADQVPYSGDGDYLASSLGLVQFDLYFHDKKLAWESTVDECGIGEGDTLKLSWIYNGLDASIATQTNERMFFRINNIKYSDTVDQIKARFCQVTGVPPEKQLLRYQNRWLKEDFKSLAEYGIIFCPSLIFPWHEHINAVDIFVRVDATRLRKINLLEHKASAEIILSPTIICLLGNCPWHPSYKLAGKDGCFIG